MSYEIVQMDARTWYIEDSGMVRCFLLTGDEMALLVDTGMNIRNMQDILKELTDLPVEVIVTHADRDHIGAVEEFPQFYMNPAEASNFYNTQGRTLCFIPAEDGDVFDLGNRSLQVISIPGHTPGSIALLDLTSGVLFSGDTVQDGAIFMFGVQREIHALVSSLEKLYLLKDYITEIYPAHGTIPLPKDAIDGVLAGAQKILEGDYEPVETQVHGKSVLYTDTGEAKFLLEMK